MKPKIILNCISVKQKSGGAYQVAKNFIKATLTDETIDWYYFVSQDLHKAEESFDRINVVKYFVFPNQPDFLHSFWKTRQHLKQLELNIKPDLIYSIAAPSYFSFRTPEVMRYTNSWTVDSNKFAFQSLDFKTRIKFFFYIELQKRLIKNCHYFITQTEACKDGIIRLTKAPPENVKVIPNTLPKLYLEFGNEIKTNKCLSSKEQIHILYVAAPHPHKNVELIPNLLLELRERYDLKNIYFHITIPETHGLARDILENARLLNVESFIINHGYCSQLELVDLYLKCDLYFFPSLLETFSVSLLEAMFFNLPIIASDFRFNRDVVADAALYFEPLNYIDAAEKIANIVLNPPLFDQLISEVKKRYLRNDYFNYDNNFQDTISFLLFMIKGKTTNNYNA